MVIKTTDHQTPREGGLIGVIGRTFLRGLQFIFALVIAGLYGKDISDGNHSSKWVYAEVVVGLTAVTTLVYLVPFVRSFKMFFWDALLFIFWTALFGVFGNIYIHKDCKGNGTCNRMKAAVWIDMIEMLMWFISAVVGGLLFWRERHSRSVFTGRAAVV